MKINAMIYHVKSTSVISEISMLKNIFEYFRRNAVQSIMFLSKLMTSVKTRYWSIELKIAELIWVLRKIRHLIKFIKIFIIIYIDHEAALDIAKQINFFTFSRDKLNLRFVRAFDYIQKFSLVIRHKSKKLHVVFDALFRLSIKTKNQSTNAEYEEELNVLFIAFMIDMSSEMKNKLILKYQIDLSWAKIRKMIEISISNDIEIFFMQKNDFIYRKKSFQNSSFISRCLCISASCEQNILAIIHDENNYVDFDKIYQRIVSSYYIKSLSTHLKKYLKHCSKCNINQIKRHRSYDRLQSIISSFTSFHTITMNFVLIMSFAHNIMNNVMTVICKFFKKVIIISRQNTWTAIQWAIALLDELNLTKWEISKIIIFDRNRKFLSNLWSKLFELLKIKLLYSTTYHSQTNETSERTNQSLKIALKYYIQCLNDFKDWFKTITIIQRNFNNNSFSIDKFLNEICYDFTSFQSSDLIRNLDYIESVDTIIMRTIVADNIVSAQMLFKHIYNNNHQLLSLKVKNWALIRFHKKYKISAIAVIERKLSQQYIDSFKIIKKIKNLTYELVVSNHWRIHSVISIAHLESASESRIDFYDRISILSSLIFMKEEFEQNEIKSFEVERIIVSKNNRQRNRKYFVKWLKYDSKENSWRSVSEFANVINLINDFERRNTSARFRNRLRNNNNHLRNRRWLFWDDNCYTKYLHILHKSWYHLF